METIIFLSNLQMERGDGVLLSLKVYKIFCTLMRFAYKKYVIKYQFV